MTDTSNFPFPSSLQNTETRYFVLWLQPADLQSGWSVFLNALPSANFHVGKDRILDQFLLFGPFFGQ